MDKKFIAITMAISLLFSGCGKEKNETADETSVALQCNDYRGGVYRTNAIKDDVLHLLDSMKSNNDKLRAQYPDDFWVSEGYQDFVSNFLSIDIIKDTSWFNEEVAPWDQVVAAVSANENSFTYREDDAYHLIQGCKLIRNEKDDYSVTGLTMSISQNNDNKYEGNVTYRALYDCNRDWCKAYSTLNIKTQAEFVPDITLQMFEYARVDINTFVIQTSTERLLVKFKEEQIDEDGKTISDLRNREIDEVYYSKLMPDSVRTTFKPFEPKIEADENNIDYNDENAKYNEEMRLYPEINNDGGVADKYGTTESMFLSELENVSPEWVFEDKSLQQAIIYKEGNLVVTTYNKLSEKYNRFVYQLADANDAIISELEAMVDIKNLVGIVSVDEVITIPDSETQVEVETNTNSEAQPEAEGAENAVEENTEEQQPSEERDSSSEGTEQSEAQASAEENSNSESESASDE